MNYGKNATKRRVQKLDKKSTKVRHKFGVIFWKCILVLVIIVGVVGISSGVGVMKGIIDSAPDISEIDVTPTGYSSTVLASDGTEISTLVASGANRKYVTIDEIPQSLQDAFVAIEDERFYEHNGIDMQSILRAAATGIAHGFHFSQGGSTITQQLIKNNVLTTWTSESSFIESLQRKIQEQYLAVELEKKVDDKKWILENYMNSINLGANTLGVQAASEKYFGKDVSELTLSESAVIAGITQNPAKYNPITHPDKNVERRERVLTNMLEQGYISQSEYDEAMDDDVYDRISEHNAVDDTSINSYFVDALIDDVFSDLIDKGYSETEAYKMIYQGGLTIQSTQDLELQKICDEEANNLDNYPTTPKYSFTLYFQVKSSDGTLTSYSNQTMLSYYKKATNNEDYSINFDTEDECYEAIAQYEQDVLNTGDEIVEGSEYVTITLQPQIALTLMDQSTGEVKAMVGGRGDKSGNRTWNRATDTCRQPGSTFKIIGCYAAALDAGGLTLASVQDDAPFTVGSKQFHNYDNSYRGYTNLRTAITNSINIVTVKTLQEIGVDLGYEYAENFGITTLTDTDKNLSLALGGLTKGVTNIELTGAYATIANSGTYLEPKLYTVVYDHDGNVLLDKSDTQDTRQVLKDTTAWLLTDAMKDVMTSGTGTRAYFGSTMAQAGKSGTTTSNRDCLWAGYTPYYTCVVWGGYDDNSKQAGSNTTYPKNIWKAVMSRVHEGLEYKDFPTPGGITSATVCSKSGLLPIEGTCDSDPRGSMLITEYFDASTVPSDLCDHHVTLTICNDTGTLANAYCPNTTTSVYIVGGEEGTADSDYLAREDLLNSQCTIHNAGSVAPAEPTTTDTTTSSTGSVNSGTNGNGNGNGNTNGGSTDTPKETYPNYNPTTDTYVVDPTVTSFPYYDSVYKQWIDSNGKITTAPSDSGTSTNPE